MSDILHWIYISLNLGVLTPGLHTLKYHFTFSLNQSLFPIYVLMSSLNSQKRVLADYLHSLKT